MSLPSTAQLRDLPLGALARCGAEAGSLERGELHPARTPITGELLGGVGVGDLSVDDAVARATEVFADWRTTPAPRRGQVVRRLGELLREHHDHLADLVMVEAGKI